MAVARISKLEPVVTGFGVVSSIGIGAERFWRAVLAGETAAHPVRSFDPSPLRNTIACEIDGFVPAAVDGCDEPPRASALGICAAREALATAGVDPAAVGAVCVGTTMGDLPTIESFFGAGEHPELVSRVTSRTLAERIAEALRIAAPAFTMGTSCSAGNLAIFRGVDLIRTGRATTVLAGGSDAFSRLAFIGFTRMRAMAPARCTPFDQGRKGILLGEGAGFVVIESREWAERRGAPMYAMIAGCGLSCDAHHISTPAPYGRGAAAAMAAALDDADIEPEQVDFVSAHGTGTIHNDAAEAAACTTVFGSHRPYVSSLKALIGHTLGAASAIQAVACTLSLRDRRVVPAWNVTTPDPECAVELPLPGRFEPKPVRVVMSNGLAFGGNNSCLVLCGIN